MYHPNNLYQLLTWIAQTTPDKCLLKDKDRSLSAALLYRSATLLANDLYREGIGSGTMVAFFLSGSLSHVVALLALRFLGTLTVLCDPRQTLFELQHTCESNLPFSYSISCDGQAVTLIRTKDHLRRDLSVWKKGQETPLFPCDLSSEGPSFVLFTSGSTGAEKAVVLSEASLIRNLTDSKDPGNCLPEDIALGILPLHHVFGLALLIGVFVVGYTLFFPSKRDPKALLEDIQREHITRMNGVPSLYLRLAENAGGYDLSSLRVGFIAGAPVSPGQFSKAEEKLGITLVPVYGMTECIGISCCDYDDPKRVRENSVGKVYASNRIKILDETGKPCPTGQAGEICVTGPMCMLGYYDQPMSADDFLYTGDLGYLDDAGYLHLCGRKKDIIIRNGNNLSSRRIEAALLSQGSVRDAVVVGIPDDLQGEVPCAMIVGHADPSQLRARLHKNEYPVKILSVPSIPVTSSGKPDKKRIQNTLQKYRSSRREDALLLFYALLVLSVTSLLLLFGASFKEGVTLLLLFLFLTLR